MTRMLPRLIGIAVSAALMVSATTAEARKKKETKPAATSTASAPAKSGGKSSSAPSAAKHGVGKGDKEVGIIFNYTNFDGGDFNSLTLGASLGTFLRDTVELRITPVVNYSKIAGMSSFAFLPYVTVEKLFPNSSPVVPYVGGGIGINLMTASGNGVDTTDIGLFVTPVGGLKFFVSERMSLEYALGFRVGFDYQCVDAAGFSTCGNGSTSGFRNDIRFNVYF